MAVAPLVSLIILMKFFMSGLLGSNLEEVHYFPAASWSEAVLFLFMVGQFPNV
jgi:hypothetical protein